jgi:hypothetical protein
VNQREKAQSSRTSFNKEILLLGEVAFCPLFYYWSEDWRKREPETRALLSALERVHWGHQQSQSTKGKKD